MEKKARVRTHPANEGDFDSLEFSRVSVVALVRTHTANEENKKEKLDQNNLRLMTSLPVPIPIKEARTPTFLESQDVHPPFKESQRRP